MLKEFKFKSSSDSRVYLSSDYHLHHSKAPVKRGFPDLATHDATLIKNHNAKIRPQDTLIFCGDFLFEANADLFKAYIEQLNGKILMLWGNHNSGTRQFYQNLVRGEGLYEDNVEIYPITYTHACGSVTFVGDYIKGWINNTPFVAQHFGFRVWDFMQKGAVNFCGHSHGSDKESNPDWPEHKRLDVGVDNFNYYPVAFEDAMEIINKKKFIQLDHHDKHTSSSF